jgi:hypothetical protein
MQPQPSADKAQLTQLRTFFIIGRLVSKRRISCHRSTLRPVSQIPGTFNRIKTSRFFFDCFSKSTFYDLHHFLFVFVLPASFDLQANAFLPVACLCITHTHTHTYTTVKPNMKRRCNRLPKHKVNRAKDNRRVWLAV